jgi:hypothetical protein
MSVLATRRRTTSTPWILWAIYTSSCGDNLLFKRGTALSKLYFSETWRYSEDLDFGVGGDAVRASGIEWDVPAVSEFWGFLVFVLRCPVFASRSGPGFFISRSVWSCCESGCQTASLLSAPLASTAFLHRPSSQNPSVSWIGTRHEGLAPRLPTQRVLSRHTRHVTYGETVECGR